MPYSDVLFDDISSKFIQNIQIVECLDIGSGAGKYGKVVRQFHPNARIVGIEIEPDYISKFDLNSIYDYMRCIAAEKIIEEDIDKQYDLVIIGDCIEHMRKSVGIDLLNFLVYRSKYILVLYPEKYLQGSWEGYRSEAHISFWKENDFSGMDFISLHREYMVAVFINGYLLDLKRESGVKQVLDL